jgi:hypothetical protein
MSKKVKSSDFGTFVGTYNKKEMKIKFPIRMFALEGYTDAVIYNQKQLDDFVNMIDRMVEKEGKFFKNMMVKAFLYGIFEYRIKNDMADLGLLKRTDGLKAKDVRKEIDRGEILLTNLLHHISVAHVYYRFYKDGHIKRILMQIGKMTDDFESGDDDEKNRCAV